jgi:hypothetical protein
MSDATDRERALAELTLQVQPDLDPALSPSELDQILDGAKRGVVWEASLAVRHGQLVFPTVSMGRRFKVTKAGVLSGSEPTWTDYDYDYATLTDGTATLLEDGVDFEGVYDVRRAAYEGWNLKVAKAASRNQGVSEGRGQASGFLYLNCVRERDKYVNVGVF